jgi:hypothetical protein
MGKRCDKHPFEDNPFVEGLFEWMDSPEGELSMEVSDALWEIMDEVRLDAGQRLFLWPEGQRLSFDQSIERLQQHYPNFPRKNIASYLIFWIDNHAPEDYSEEQLAELDRLTEGWTDELDRQYMAD